MVCFLHLHLLLLGLGDVVALRWPSLDGAPVGRCWVAKSPLPLRFIHTITTTVAVIIAGSWATITAVAFGSSSSSGSSGHSLLEQPVRQVF